MGSHDFLDLSADEHAAMAAVGKSFSLLRRAADRKLSAHEGLTRAQFEIFGYLTHTPEGLRMFELADRLTLSRSTMTHHVNHLGEARARDQRGRHA